MYSQTNPMRSKLAAAGVALTAALALGTAAPVYAHPDDMDHGMEMHGHGGWHGHGGYGHEHGEGMFKPHNAAMHFIMLGHELGLDQNQMQQLKKMRDQYIQNNAVAEEQVKADKMDLKWLLMSNIAAQSFDKKAVDAKLQDIVKLKKQLWTAYVDQLQSINQLLTAQQKDKLMTMMAEYAHGGPMHGMGGMKGRMGHGMKGGMNMNNGQGNMHQGNMNNNMNDNNGNGGQNGSNNGG